MTRRLRIEDLTSFAIPEQPTLSPDGRQVAYVLRTIDADADRTVRSLWRVETADGAAGGAPVRLTRGTADTAPAWSPDGAAIAFLRADDGPAQIWVLPAGGGEPERQTTLPLGAGPPLWSPDGRMIAFTAPVDQRADDGEDDAARARRAAAPIEADRLDYQDDGTGLLHTIRGHLHVLDLANRACRQLTSGDWHASEPAWSPDSARLAFAAATAPDADLTPRSPVYLLDLGDAAPEPALAGLADGNASAVTWAPDGAALIVVGHPGAPTGHARLLRLPLGGGTVTDLAAPLDRNVMVGGPGYPGARPQFAADGRTLLFCVRDRGCTHLYAVPADGGAPRPVVTGAGRVVAGVSAAAGSAAIVLATPASFGEVAIVDVATGAETVRTGHGASYADAEPFARQDREFTISDGTVVHGWLVRDPDRGPGPGPLLLDIHGGPHNAWNGAADPAHLYHAELAARGWTILLLNPRASDGYGAEFYTAALGAWGAADARDFLEPIDQLVAEGVADPARLAVTGYSYGGFMTCYLTSRDDRFAAAVAGGVVADLTSVAGTSDARHYLSSLQLGGQPWADPDRYAELSPLARVADVRTPTLIVHGTADLRCPVGQAQQWHTALRERGVPTRLVLYPDASHLFILTGRPSHRIDHARRVVDWVDRYAGSAAGPRRPRIDAEHWQRRLAVLARRNRVPGAVLGVLRLGPDGDDERIDAAYGVLNKDTGVTVTPDTLFQIGSITKVFTATVVMRLAEDGRLDLDAPVANVLPELRLADPGVTSQVTMRHLLTHTSGIDGDVFTDAGRGDDCVQRYVALLADAAQNHPLGATWSYCNSGFVLAGRVIEQLTGTTWDAALADRLLAPLGLDRTVTLPEQALLHRAAVGHVAEGGGEPARAPAWTLPRSVGPAGLICSTAADVLAFARLHLTGGLAPDGTRLLSQASADAMAARQADLPTPHGLGDSWGLGWSRFGWDSRRLIGHDGDTIGQSAFLRILPEEGLAVVLLTNGGAVRDLYEDLFAEIFAELAGVAMPRPLTPPATPAAADIGEHAGRYERAGTLIEVLAGGDGARLRTTVTGPLADLLPDPVTDYPLVPVERDLYAVREPGSRFWSPVAFYRLPTGERYVHLGARATPRVG
ncbi:MAG: serine hydrolase [Streptosporangiaceae bacterium]